LWLSFGRRPGDRESSECSERGSHIFSSLG
jgi:hypothetical protein